MQEQDQFLLLRNFMKITLVASTLIFHWQRQFGG